VQRAVDLQQAERVDGAFGATVGDVADLGTRIPRFGRVENFDAERGLGIVVAASGTAFRFHGTAIADDSRQIAVGIACVFTVAAAPGGVYEAVGVTPLASSSEGASPPVSPGDKPGVSPGAGQS